MVSLINRNSPKKKLKKKTDTSSEKGQVDPIPVIELDQSPKKKLKTKIDTDIEKGQVDPIPGIEMGQRSQNKNQLKELKVHVPTGKKKIQQIKLISVILVQNVSALYRYKNLNNHSFKTTLQTLQPKLIKKLSHMFLYSLENGHSFILLIFSLCREKDFPVSTFYPVNCMYTHIYLLIYIEVFTVHRKSLKIKIFPWPGIFSYII